MITFTVYGTPIPQGSMKAFMPRGARFPVVTADNAKTRPWRQSIVEAARAALGGSAPIASDIGIELYVVFYLPRSRSAPNRVTEPATRPDVDKLLRAMMDALTAAGIWRDDAQVIMTFTRKAFAGGVHDPMASRGVPRAEVRVREAQVAPLLHAPLLEVRA